MLNRKFMLIAIFLVGLLAMSAVSATDLNGTDEIVSDDGFDDSLGIVQDDSFLTNDSSDGDSLLQGSEEHDSSIGLADEKDILESSSDDSFLTNNPNDGDSFDDYIVWYDKDVNGFANITCTENPDNITIKLSVDGRYLLANAYLTLMDDLGDNFENSNNISIVGMSPLFADFDLAIINNYDYKITKLTMDSNGIAVFEIPFVVKEFSFCVGGWYDEGHICDYANITQTFEFDVDGTSMVYNLSAMTLVFNGGTWHNSNWQNGTVDNNSSGGNNSNWQNGTVDNNSSVGDNGTIDNGTFTALQNKINCASEGSTLYLENDYFYYDGFSFREMDIMSIEKSLIIDGNGHSIDALGKSGIFYIFGDITLKNIRFCNANSNGSHGAICGSGYDVVNCTFVNNSAKYGSAINDANQVVNCTFICNSASEVDTGDVIYDADYVVNCSFVNNSADVIYIADYVVNCSFVNNSARAIISTNHVVNCSFVNNSAFEGGAISNANYILNCSFVNNSAFEGGAIYSDYNFSVVNCSFVNNSAWNGGAIWGSVYNVVNCSFFNNSAWNYLDEEGYYVVAYGGAMYRGSAVNCNFSGNYVTEYGGAIYSGSAVNCTFIGNFASDDGGAIYGGSAKGCSFVNNSAGEHGGAIHSSSAVNCNFINNSAYWSDAISFYSLDSYDTSVEIEEGTVIDFNNPYGSSVKEIKIDNCNIQDDSLNNYGCIEVVGKRLILASTGNNDKVMVIISGEEYLPYSCEQMSKEKGEYTVVYEVLLFNLTDLSDGWYEAHLYYLGDPLHNILEITVPIYLQQTIPIPSDDNNSSVGNVTDNNTNTSTGNTTNSNTTNTTGGNASNTKPTPEIVVPPLDKPSNDGTVSLTLPNDATGTITLTINNNDYYFAVVNGVAKVVIPNLGNGNYPYTITYSGDSKYASFTTNASLTVNNIIPTTITPAASKVTTVYGGKYTVATLKDGSGKVIAGVKVTVKFSNGKTATATTDKYGKIKVTITGLVPLKTYKATITYAGNTKYAKSTKAVNVYVKKATPKITAKAKTFKKSTKTKKYAVKLNVNQKVKVAIKVNKKTYYAYTNAKGQATFKITKLAKKGKYTATVSSVANKCYNKAKSVNVKINVK